MPNRAKLTRENYEFIVAYQLLNRRTSIFAAAKIIKGILKDITKHQKNKWPKQFIRSGKHFSVNDPYVSMYPSESKDKITMQRHREQNLSELVVSIYNSDAILTTKFVHDVPIHG